MPQIPCNIHDESIIVAGVQSWYFSSYRIFGAEVDVDLETQ